jgi:phosphatidylglycerophosphate synthase
LIDRFVLPLLQRVYSTPARVFLRAGVTADRMTLAGFAVGLLAVPLLWSGLYGAALAAILANRIMDGLDGAIAREAGPTDRGAFADIAFDFVFYALVPVGFALADPAENALAAAVLIAAFVGSGTSFLAYAAVAGRRGTVSDAYPRKGIHYLGGLTEGAETIGFFALICLWPAWFAPLAYAYAAACAVTTVTRWRQGWVAFEADRDV